MHFFVPDLSGGSVNGEQAAHFISMRVRPGEIVPVTDLQGQVGRIKIKQVQKHNHFVDFQLTESRSVAVPRPKILIQAVPDKQYLDKLMEVLPLSGVTTAYFFFSEHSPQQQVNPERMERICIRSCEQGELAYKPEFAFLQPEEVEAKLKEIQPVVLELQTGSNSHNKVSDACLVGPEGGWSAKELELFNQIGLPLASMGSTVWPAWLAGYTWFVGQVLE